MAVVSGLVCLQGGHEFTAGCVEMDSVVLARVRSGPVAVLAGAAQVGGDYDGASARARRYYEAMGADVVIVPDPRAGRRPALDALSDQIAIIVLPGGSPAGLRQVLDGEIGDRVTEMHRAGCAISGASAGAMVLCSRMVRPGRRETDVVDGLGLVDGLALPHWSPGRTRDWPVPDDLDLWGLPECGGALIEKGHEPVGVGEREAALRVDGRWQTLPQLA